MSFIVLLTACLVAPGEPHSDYHYRTKIPGWVHGIKDDRCWYRGPPMKPREELYWPAEIMRRGAKPGWEHDEGAESDFRSRFQGR